MDNFTNIVSACVIVALSIALIKYRNKTQAKFAENTQNSEKNEFWGTSLLEIVESEFDESKLLFHANKYGWYKSRLCDEEGNTPLLFCLMNSKVSIDLKFIDKMLEYGCSIDDSNMQKFNIIHITCFKKYIEILKHSFTKMSKEQKNTLLLQKTANTLWSPLHCCATNGSVEGFKTLFEENILDIESTDIQDGYGNTCMMIVCSNNFRESFDLLMKYNPNLTILNNKKQSCYHFACSSSLSIVKSLTEQLHKTDLIDSSDNKLITPFYISAISMKIDIIIYLILLNNNNNIKINKNKCNSDKYSIIMQLISNINKERYNNIIKILQIIINFNQFYFTGETNNIFYDIDLSYQRNNKKSDTDLSYYDQFGLTAFLLAARAVDFNILKILLDADPSVINDRDNDGLTALHHICSVISTKSVDYDEIINIIELFDKCNFDFNSIDYSKSTALHILCCKPESQINLKIIKYLIEIKKCNYELEDHTSWNCLHFCYNFHGEYSNEIIEYLKNIIINFDQNKERDINSKYYIQNRGSHNKIDSKIRYNILKEERNLKGISNYLKKGSKIIFLVGAGASVNAGISDFRSQTGLYNSEETRKLFRLEYLMENNNQFYDQFYQMFHLILEDKIRPTITHLFLKLLQDNDMLLRVYTQNIDCLEMLAGVDKSKVVQCHGNAINQFKCAECGNPHDLDNKLKIWETLKETYPVCVYCGGIIRPNVVFFGEPVSVEYSNNIASDLAECTLLVVLGTTLVVYPVAGIPSQCPATIPRLLINKERVGPWKSDQDMNEYNYRDVCYLGDCDEGVLALAKEIGLDEQLQEMKANYKSDFSCLL